MQKSTSEITPLHLHYYHDFLFLSWATPCPKDQQGYRIVRNGVKKKKKKDLNSANDSLKQ